MSEADEIAAIDLRAADLRSRRDALQKMYDDAPTYEQAVAIGSAIPAAQDAIDRELVKLDERRMMLLSGVADTDEPEPKSQPAQLPPLPARNKGFVAALREKAPEHAESVIQFLDAMRNMADQSRAVRSFTQGEFDALELAFSIVVANSHTLLERVEKLEASRARSADRGAFRDGQTYELGDGVSHAGSYWLAQTATTERPGEGSKDWRLAVKKGRDGKDADPAPLLRLIEARFDAIEQKMEKRL